MLTEEDAREKMAQTEHFGESSCKPRKTAILMEKIYTLWEVVGKY